MTQARNIARGTGTTANQLVALDSAGKLPAVDGSQLTGITAGLINVQTFTTSGVNTWNKPTGYGANSQVHIQAWGGGGSGAKGTGGGGGGGAYNEIWLPLSALGSTESVTVGAGGAAVSTISIGNQGGNTSFGSKLTVYGGGRGTTGGEGGGGAGLLDAGGVVNPGNPTASAGQGSDGLSVNAQDGNWGGGGGAGNYGTYIGGRSVYGGGGGGSTGGGAGGTSIAGGNGGAGSLSGSGVAGSQPGGGGGGTNSGASSGAGGNGKCIVTVFPG